MTLHPVNSRYFSYMHALYYFPGCHTKPCLKVKNDTINCNNGTR